VLALIIVLIVLGTLLVAAEVFIPGMVAGILGGCAILAAIVLGYWHYGFAVGNFMLLLTGLAALIGFFAWLHFFPRTFVGRRLLLKEKIKSVADHPHFETLLGKKGIALTPLRPSGTALVDGNRIDVIAEGDMIAAQEKIKIVQVDGVRVVVRPQ
jgi:membrane-bound serine protease (ClpP class)